MALYTGCRVTIKLPPSYPRKDELAQVIKSEFEGCEVFFAEDVATREPYAEKAVVSETSPLSGARASSGWTPSTDPFAPMVNISGSLLLRSVEETVQKFLKGLRH
jgi:hypothetical protein